MAEYSNSNVVEVATGQNLPLTETAVPGGNCIVHRSGAGIITLRGLTNQRNARFRVSFGANIAIPEDGTVESISIGLAVNGEVLTSATAVVTPAAVENYYNVFVSAFILVPKDCCITVAAENVSSQSINVSNSNMIVERTA